MSKQKSRRQPTYTAKVNEYNSIRARYNFVPHKCNCQLIPTARDRTQLQSVIYIHVILGARMDLASEIQCGTYHIGGICNRNAGKSKQTEISHEDTMEFVSDD